MARTVIGYDGTSRTLHEFLLQPSFVRDDVSVDDVNLVTDFVVSDKGLKLNIPILTAAMQSVTGPRMARGIAKLGGAGVIYCSQTIEDEARMVREVKRTKAGFVTPEVLSPEDTLGYAAEKMRTTGYSKFPVTSDGTSNGILLGLLTDNDFDADLHKPLAVNVRMRKIEDLDVAYDDKVHDDIKIANNRIKEGHHSVLPIIYRDSKRLKALVFRKDMIEHEENPHELLDNDKRYIVGAAINTHDYKQRAPSMIEAGADFLVIDTSQGFSEFVRKTMIYLKKEFSHVPIIGGNVVTADGFRFLVECGADAVKVGMGSGSICITQEQIGVGSGQATAVKEVSDARDWYLKEKKIYIPICSDGSIITARDMLNALALGADYVMTGGYVAGTDESNGPEDIVRKDVDGRMMEMRGKHYWGEGSNKAKEWSGNRYGNTRFEEGIETIVPYAGSLKDRLSRALSQVRDGMRKSGSYSIHDLHKNAVLRLVSPTSLTISRGKPVGG